MLPAIGYGIRRENRQILADPAINAAEITFENAHQALRLERFVDPIEYDYVSVHALEMSLCGSESPPVEYLEAVRDIAVENGAAAVSDHLGFTRDHNSGVGMGHFASPPFSRAALVSTCRNIEFVQDFYGDLPFYIENIAYLFKFKGELTEAEFVKGVLKSTGCGWLLDVTNVYANSINHGYDAREFIQSVMPSTSRVQLHLAGGFFDEEAGFYVDSHSEPLNDEIFDLYRFTLKEGRGKIEAVFIERDANHPDDAGWRSEVRRVREIAEEVEGVTCPLV